MTTDKHQAEALADLYTADHWPSHMTLHEWAKSSADMLRRIPALEAERDDLQHEVDGLTNTVIRQGDILRDVVIAVRGEPPENTGWSSHDAADLVRGLAAECARLRDALDDAQADASVAQMALEAVLAVATGTVQHTYRGDCTEPDRPDAFDPECPACVAIRTAREAQR